MRTDFHDLATTITVAHRLSDSLDRDTDEKMRQIIKSELADCTVVAVAHRIGTSLYSQSFSIYQAKSLLLAFSYDH